MTRFGLVHLAVQYRHPQQQEPEYQLTLHRDASLISSSSSTISSAKLAVDES